MNVVKIDEKRFKFKHFNESHLGVGKWMFRAQNIFMTHIKIGI